MRLIIGASANAVREKIFAELAAVAQAQQSAYLLVPEQFTMQTDLMLLNALDTDVIMDIKVKSFGSLSREVLSKTGGIKLAFVGEDARRMLSSYLLEENGEELRVLGRVKSQAGAAVKMLETLSEFRAMGMKGADVLALADGEAANPLLKDKLSDMALLLGRYEDLLGEARLDNEARLFLLAEKIHEADWLRGLPIYIDGFHSLSHPELGVVREMESMGAEVTIGMVLSPDALTNKVGFWVGHEAYMASLRFYDSLKEAGFTLQTELIDTDEAVLASARPLARGLFSYEAETVAEAPEGFAIWKAPNPKLEVSYLAGWLRKKVIEEGYRWRDFYITTNASTVYYPLLERLFKQYEIPVFVDERKSVEGHYLARYLLNAIDMVAYGFNYPAVFACLKTGLAGLSDEEVQALDYYARAKHLRGGMYFDARYFALPDEEVTSRKVDGLRKRHALANQAREKFTARFKPFWEDMKKAKTVRDFSTLVYYFLTSPELMDNLHADDGDKSALEIEIDERITDAVVGLLDQLVETIGEMTVDVKGFGRILAEGLGEASLGILPPAQDQVMVGDIGRARSGRCKVEIVLGMSDAWLPSTEMARTIFIKEEKRWLANEGVTLRFDEGRMMEDEAMSLYEAVTKPQEMLIFSYPLSESGGAGVNESIYIARAKAIYPNLEEKSLLADFDTVRPYLEWESLVRCVDWLRLCSTRPELAEDNDAATRVASYYRYYAENRQNLAPFLDDGLYYSNVRKRLAPEMAKKLYLSIEKGTVSISELESWQGCPYKHFLRYGIRPEEGLDYTLRADELGSVLHGALDGFTKALRATDDWENWDEAAIYAQIDRYLDEERARTLDSQRSEEARNRAVLTKLRAQGHKAGKFIVRQLRESSFKPRFNEMFFGENSPVLPPIYLDLGGQILRIEGRIDRVDTYSDGQNLYARVIDYKSGFNSFDIARVWAGLDLQLLLYLRAVMGWQKAPLPAGVFYLSLKDPFVSTESLDEATIEKLIASELLMDGVFVDDPEVLAALDHGAREGEKRVVKFSGRGKTPENGVSVTLLDKLLQHAVDEARRTAIEVTEGDISVHPLEDDKASCTYCDYASICRFEKNSGGNKVRDIEKVDWKGVKERLNEEGET